MAETAEIYRFTVAAEDVDGAGGGEGEAAEESIGPRLDVWLAAREQPFSRSALYRRIEAGEVRVGGEVVRVPHHALRAGDVVELAPPPPVDIPDPPEDIPLGLVFEDEHLVVVDKPAGLVVHPAHRHDRGTLLNALLFRLGGGRLSIAGERRPGFVHRLDRGTSGLMVVARHDRALRRLSDALAAGRVTRRYLALVDGDIASSGTFDTAYGRSARDRRRFTSRVEIVLGAPERAVTHWRVIEPLGGAALVEITLETGRTHQIRVHFAEHGHPLLGDRIYGRPSRTPLVRGVAARLERPALHSAVIALEHPMTGAAMRFAAELPSDVRAALERLRGR